MGRVYGTEHPSKTIPSRWARNARWILHSLYVQWVVYVCIYVVMCKPLTQYTVCNNKVIIISTPCSLRFDYQVQNEQHQWWTLGKRCLQRGRSSTQNINGDRVSVADTLNNMAIAQNGQGHLAKVLVCAFPQPCSGYIEQHGRRAFKDCFAGTMNV